MLYYSYTIGGAVLPTSKQERKTDMKDFFEALAGCLIIAGAVALFCAATPDQLSGEADANAERCHGLGIAYVAAEGGAE